MVEVRRFLDWNEAAECADRWNELVIRGAAQGTPAGLPSFFQTYEWNRAWWRSFGQGHELLLLGAFDGERLVGLAPLMVSRKKFPIPSKVVRLIGGPNFASDYCAFIFEPGREDVLRALVRWVIERRQIWDEADFVNWIEGSPGTAVLVEEFSKTGMKASLRFMYDAPTIRLSGTDADREITNKKSLKRHFNWFKNQGRLEFSHLESPTEIQAQLEAFFEQHIGRRSLSEAPSLFLDPAQKEFYRELVTALQPKGWLRFFSVRLEGKPVAFHFGFEFSGRYYWYKPTFDIQYVKKSPGEVLLKTLIEYSIDRGLKEFDFTAGAEAFKYRFANHVRKLYRFQAFRSWPQYLVFRGFVAALAVKRGLRSLRSKLAARRPQRDSGDSAPESSSGSAGS